MGHQALFQLLYLTGLHTNSGSVKLPRVQKLWALSQASFVTFTFRHSNSHESYVECWSDGSGCNPQVVRVEHFVHCAVMWTSCPAFVVLMHSISSFPWNEAWTSHSQVTLNERTLCVTTYVLTRWSCSYLHPKMARSIVTERGRTQRAAQCVLCRPWKDHSPEAPGGLMWFLPKWCWSHTVCYKALVCISPCSPRRQGTAEDEAVGSPCRGPLQKLDLVLGLKSLLWPVLTVSKYIKDLGGTENILDESFQLKHPQKMQFQKCKQSDVPGCLAHVCLLL